MDQSKTENQGIKAYLSGKITESILNQRKGSAASVNSQKSLRTKKNRNSGVDMNEKFLKKFNKVIQDLSE